MAQNLELQNIVDEFTSLLEKRDNIVRSIEKVSKAIQNKTVEQIWIIDEKLESLIESYAAKKELGYAELCEEMAKWEPFGTEDIFNLMKEIKKQDRNLDLVIYMALRKFFRENNDNAIKNWTGKLYLLAEDLRERFDNADLTNLSSYMEAYRHGAEEYLHKGKEITAEQLRQAYDSAKSKGFFDKLDEIKKS